MVYFFAQNATIKAKTSGGAYEVVGAAQEVSFEMNYEDVKLYQFGTTKRVDAARHSLSIPVTVKLAKFSDPNTGGNDWFWKILNENGWQTVSEGKKISITDSTSFPMFCIAGEFRSTDGQCVIYAEATDVYFKTFQWGGTLGEYIMENLEGEGADMNFGTFAPSGWGTGTDTKLYVTSPQGPIAITVGNTQTVTLNVTGTSHAYLVGSSNTNVATATVAVNGTITITGVSEGPCAIFASADGSTLSIPVTVTGA